MILDIINDLELAFIYKLSNDRHQFCCLFIVICRLMSTETADHQKFSRRSAHEVNHIIHISLVNTFLDGHIATISKQLKEYR
jgi:hypothetical protein